MPPGQLRHTHDSPSAQEAPEADGAAGVRALPEMLADHCRRLGAEGGAVLRVCDDGAVEVVAAHPAPPDGPAGATWLREAIVSAGQVVAAGGPVLKPVHEPDELYGQEARRQVVMVPLGGERTGRGVVAFAADPQRAGTLARDLGRMEEPVGVLGVYQSHLPAPRARGGPELAAALATLAAVNEHDRFLAAAMAFCNEVASRWRCDRVSLGFLKGADVHLAAMSHTERFRRKMKGVRQIEEAMAECLDQDVEVLHPPPPEPVYVSRSARALAEAGGRMTVLSLPLRRRGDAVGVVTLERPAEAGCDARQIESLRLTCELCAPRLLDLRRQDRWIGAKAADAARRVPAALVGPRHTWAKVLVALLAGGAVFLAVAQGEYRLEARCVLQPTRRQVIPAPFAGQVAEALVKVGDRVETGRLLARLKTRELERELSALEAERFEAAKQVDAARAGKKWAEAQMGEAKVRQLDERIGLVQEQIGKARIEAPLSGTVVRGDLETLVGATVEKGRVLFEIAPIRLLRAELSVPEDRIADLLAATRRGAVHGRLAAASYPDERIAFQVDRICPMAEAEDGRVVFKVRARLDGTRPWMWPGMEGVAHVSLGRRRYAWLWIRRLAHWLRLRFWL